MFTNPFLRELLPRSMALVVEPLALILRTVRVGEDAETRGTVVGPLATETIPVGVDEVALAVLLRFVPLADVLVAVRVRERSLTVHLVALPTAFVSAPRHEWRQMNRESGIVPTLVRRYLNLFIS